MADFEDFNDVLVNPKNISILEEFIRKNGIDAVGERKETLLFQASAEGYSFLVKELLKRGADVNKKCYFGYTPLHMASGQGNTKIVRILLSIGALPDEKGRDGITPLFFAAENLDLETARLLLDAGANPKPLDKKCRNPFERNLINYKKGATEEMEALLDSYYNVDIKEPGV